MEIIEDAVLEQTLEKVVEVAEELHEIDLRVRSVGITRTADGYAYHVVRNSEIPMPFRVGRAMPVQIHGLPLVFSDSPGEVESMVMFPANL